MKLLNNSLYIRFMDEAADSLEEGISPENLQKKLNQEFGYEYSVTQIDNRLSLLYSFVFDLNMENLDEEKITATFKYPFRMNGESFSRLMEFKELQLARENSREARILSMLAIILALIAVIFEYLF